jgi:tRNA A37 methylthiotransferase MiaB
MAITGDIIAGFPSEEEEDFEASLAMLDALEMEDAHVFGFSIRGGTEAEHMEGQLPPPIIQARGRRLRDAARARWERAWAARLGQQIDVATFRSAGQPGLIDAHSGQGSRVRVSHERSSAPVRSMLRVRVTGIDGAVVCAVEDAIR